MKQHNTSPKQYAFNEFSFLTNLAVCVDTDTIVGQDKLKHDPTSAPGSNFFLISTNLIHSPLLCHIYTVKTPTGSPNII